MAQVESIISPDALPIFGQFFTAAEFLMECGNEYFIVPAPTDNMAEKTLVKTHRASFPPRTLAEIASMVRNKKCKNYF